jgi:N-methylhydantoinase A
VLGREYDVDELVAEARDRLGDGEAQAEVVYECRFKGQSFELTVTDPADFPRVHEERYGFTEDGGEVEVVTVRATARVPGAEVELGGDEEGEPAPGTRVAGPRVFALPESTLYVPEGWVGDIDHDGTVVLHRSG